MTNTISPGLGELLRYVGELVDHGAAARYEAMGLSYRPRYTPVMRALAVGADTISSIKACSQLTQGAVSQSVALMIQEGLLTRDSHPDGRKSVIRLSARGTKLMKALKPHWGVTFEAIRRLECDIGYPLLAVLQAAAVALEKKGFNERLDEARAVCVTAKDDPAL